MSKDTRIAFRVSKDMKIRLAAVAKKVKLTETTLAEACVEALIEYIETHGEIRLPIALTPRSELSKKAIHDAGAVILPPARRGSLSTLQLNEAPSEFHATESRVKPPEKQPSKKR